MITIDVAEYCSACMDFDPDVQRPQKEYRMIGSDGVFTRSEEIVISDTVIRCSNRNRCKNIERSIAVLMSLCASAIIIAATIKLIMWIL